MTTLEQYLSLQRSMIAMDKLADQLRSQMDDLWWRMTDEERKTLDEREP